MLTEQVSTKSNSPTRYDIASHGNYHLFEFRDNCYIYDVEKINVIRISKALYGQVILNNEQDIANLINEVRTEIPTKPTSFPQVVSQDLNYISLNVAQVCNLSCVYCYGVDGEYGTKGMMNETTAFKSVDFLLKESGKTKDISIGFFGGEPLLNFPLIKKVVDYSRIAAAKVNKRITFSMTTNGTKFSPEINDYLNKNNFGIIVSFDGDEEAQNNNRPFRGGQGSYDITKPLIEEFLRSRNGRATARATITNHTTNLKIINDKLLNMGFSKAHATVATLSEFAVTNRPVEKVDKSQYYNIFEAYEEEADELFTAIQHRNIPSNLGASRILTYINQLKSKNKNYHPCGVGRKMVGISITGDVYPCHRFVGEEKFKLGNVENFDTDSRAIYSKSHIESNPVCSKCWAKYQCGGGGCIQDNEVMMGGVDNVNTSHCAALKHQLKLAIDLFSKLSIEDKAFLFDNKY